MQIYLIPLFVAAISGYCTAGCPKMRSVYFLPLILMLLLFTAPFKGPDYYAYEDIYNSLPDVASFINEPELISQFHGEALFLLLASSIANLGIEYLYFQALIISISITLKVYLFKRYSRSAFVSVVWYISAFLYYDITAIRHGIASGLIAFALFFLAQRKFVRSSVSVVIAGFLHTVAFSALLVPLFRVFLRYRILLFVFWVGAVFISVFGIGRLFGHVVDFSGYGADSRLVNNVIDYSIGYLSTEPMGLFRGSVLKATLIIFLLLSYPNNFLAGRLDLYLASGYILGYFVLLTMNDVPIFADRTFVFYGWYECFFISKLVDNINNFKKLQAISIVFIFALIQLIWFYENLFKQ